MRYIIWLIVILIILIDQSLIPNSFLENNSAVYLRFLLISLGVIYVIYYALVPKSHTILVNSFSGIPQNSIVTKQKTFHNLKQRSSLRNLKESDYSHELWMPLDSNIIIPVSSNSPKKVWKIGLFHQERVYQYKPFYKGTEEGYFILSDNDQNSKEVIWPIVKKFLSRYRKYFEKTESIKIIHSDVGETIYTNFKSERALHMFLFDFTEKFIEISKDYKAFPSLSIIWNNCFMFEIITSNHFKYVHALRDFISNFEEVEIREYELFTKIRIWIGFNKQKSVRKNATTKII